MSLLSLLGISTAQAATTTMSHAGHPGPASMFSPLLIMVGFIAVFYFLIIRPQNRKRKEQAELVNKLEVGDEVLTVGGIAGRISKLKDNFLDIMIAENTTITIQRSAVANILPKGTLEL